jgi:hypothetical protein
MSICSTKCQYVLSAKIFLGAINFLVRKNLKTDFSARLGKKNFQLFQLNLSVNMIFSAKTFIKLLFSFEK